MRWRLKELQGEYLVKTGQALTYEDITAATGLSSNTLSTIATNKAKRADLETFDRLITLFRDRLDRPLTTADLLEYLPD